jgi:hypothetical protein
VLVTLYHSERVSLDLRASWEKYFGLPGPMPNGALLGGIVMYANGKKSAAEIRGGDYYDTELLRAHTRGENAAEAFKFLAEVGARLYSPDHPMLGRLQQQEAADRFGA